MTNRRFAALLLGLLPLAAMASGGGDLQSSGASVKNKASLQRGAATYMSYCAGCHAIGYQRFSRMAADLDLTDEQVQTYLNPAGQKVGEQMHIAMDPADAQAWFADVRWNTGAPLRAESLEAVVAALAAAGAVDPVTPGTDLPERVVWTPPVA